MNIRVHNRGRENITNSVDCEICCWRTYDRVYENLELIHTKNWFLFRMNYEIRKVINTLIRVIKYRPKPMNRKLGSSNKLTHEFRSFLH